MIRKFGPLAVLVVWSAIQSVSAFSTALATAFGRRQVSTAFHPCHQFFSSHTNNNPVAAATTRQATAGSPAILEPPVKEETQEVVKKDQGKEEQQINHKKGGWAVRLFNDTMNKREFVAMCLSKIVGLTDGQAYQVMMQAHQQGVAIVGRFDHERAELYRNSLVEHGLVSDMIPVEED